MTAAAVCLLCAAFTEAYVPAAEEPAPSDKVTVMVYMIGSDLESEYGCASADLEEMMAAEQGEQMTVVVQTGGALQWENSSILPGSCQRFVMKDHALTEWENIGLKSMAQPDTLADFIRWGASNFPAERYELILWDHGGGTAAGYGYDEYFPEDWMSLSELAAALEQGGCHFDMIGFDACLMGTVEMAYAVSPYADYMVASEEYIPQDGFSYTGWMNLLGQNSSIDTEELGRCILDEYAAYYNEAGGEEYTLSLLDLSKTEALNSSLADYMKQSSGLLLEHRFGELSSARAHAKAYGDGDYEQIDMADYISRVDSVDGSGVKAALESCVVYSVSNIAEAGGLAMYYPYQYLEDYSAIRQDLNTCGYVECEEYFDLFASIIAGAKQENSNAYFGEGQSTQWEYSSCDWYSDAVAEDYSDVYLANSYDEQEIVDKGGYYALPMSEEAWDVITYIEQWVYLDDGEGYVDLGSDNYYEVDEDNDLIVDFDYYWVALDGMVVPFYAEEENYGNEESWYTYGFVPAELNDTDDIEMIVRWDSEHEDGYISGWRYAREGLGQAAAKGLYSFKPGDRVAVYCDYYTYEGEYEGAYYWGDSIVIGDTLPSVSYEDIGDYTTLVSYMLTDIYQNYYYTETVELYIDSSLPEGVDWAPRNM